MIETTVKIDGMMCCMCEAHVCDVIRQKFDVKKVSASHSKGQAVILSEQPINESELRAAIKATGYEVMAVTSAAQADKPKKGGLFGLFRH